MRSTKFLTVFLISLLSVYSVSTAQIKVIAHRGHWNINATGSGNTATPQNSLASYKAADDLGAWGSEFDVNMTSDGQLVVCHGPKIVSLADVQKETFATVRGEHLSNGEAVPSLDELLQLFFIFYFTNLYGCHVLIYFSPLKAQR